MAKKPVQVPGDTPEEETAAPTLDEPQAEASTLPHIDDIDPKTLSRSALTQQGWVCPG